MKYITFNAAVCNSLIKMRPVNVSQGDVFMLFLPLEVGNIITPENSKTNEILYDILAGKGSYLNFIQEVKFNYFKIWKLDENEEICFWIDFNDVKQYLNFAYFIKIFDRFKNKFYVEYDFNRYCENADAIYEFETKKKPLAQSLILLLKADLLKVQQEKDLMFRTVINKKLISVRDDYFDKYIMEFLDEKPKSCMQLIGQIFSKFGRLSVSFDQVVIRLWLLLREGVIERIGAKTENDLFFEYKYKLSDHTFMQKDS